MENPSVWTRLRAVAQGEVSSHTLEAYRRASLVVLELLDRVEATRTQAELEGKAAWTLPPGVQTEMLCPWNAFVLQSLGTEFLDADYRDQPATKGFVPPITADQVVAFFEPVEGWLGHFFCCPWGTVYEVYRPVILGGSRLKGGDQFVLDLSAEGTELGHPFKRGIKKGNYTPTEKFEYGDPSEPPDH